MGGTNIPYPVETYNNAGTARLDDLVDLCLSNSRPSY
jgi:hypothetical protein